MTRVVYAARSAGVGLTIMQDKDVALIGVALLLDAAAVPSLGRVVNRTFPKLSEKTAKILAAVALSAPLLVLGIWGAS